MIFGKLIDMAEEFRPTGGGRGGWPIGLVVALGAGLLAGCDDDEKEETSSRALPKDWQVDNDVLHQAFAAAGKSDQAAALSALGSWDNFQTDNSLQGLLIRTVVKDEDGQDQEVYFVRNPQQQGGVVSESVYWMRIAASMYRLGVDNAEAKKVFAGLLRGMDYMTRLAQQAGSTGSFPAWKVHVWTEANFQGYAHWAENLSEAEKIKNNNPSVDKLVRIDLGNDQFLVLDPADMGPHNSASDADHDLVMSLLMARQTWPAAAGEDWEYSQRLDGLITGLEAEYLDQNDWYLLQPSEDYLASSTEKDYRLDYLSPETCFAIAEYLAEKNPTDQRIAQWRKRGLDSMKIYLTCLQQYSAIPARAWITVDESGKLTIEPNGAQSYDGIRAPWRIAAALPYLERDPELQTELNEYINVDGGYKSVFSAYLKTWNGNYTTQPLDAAMYLPLAVQLGEVNAARSMASVVLDNTMPSAIYQGGNLYYETSLTMLSFLDSGFSHEPQQERFFSSGQPLYPKPQTELYDADNSGLPYYGLTANGRGYVVNTAPVLADIVPSGQVVINSESLAYGLYRALEENDKEKFNALMHTVYYLTARNYAETDRTTKLLPWAVLYDGHNMRIAQRTNVSHYGNASASDADLMLLAVMIRAIDKGFGDADLRNWITVYADNFIQHNMTTYKDENGVMRWVMLPGSLRPDVRDDSGDRLIEYHLSYPNYEFMDTIANYFAKAERESDNNTGATSFYLAFAGLRADTEALLKQIVKDYLIVEPVKFAEFPETLWLRLPAAGGKIEILHPESANKEEYETYRPRPDAVAALRLPINLPSETLGTELYNYFATQLANIEGQELPSSYAESVAYMDAHRPEDDYSEVSVRSRHEDFKYNNNLLWPLVDNALRKHGWGDFSPFYDERFAFDEAEQGADNAQQNIYAEVFYTGSQNYALESGIMYARSLAKSRVSVEQAKKVYQETLLRALADPQQNNLIGLPGVIGHTTSPGSLASYFYDDPKSYLVEEYLKVLSNMLGYTDVRLLAELDRLLAQAQTQETFSFAHPVVKTIYLQKIFLLGAMPESERQALFAVISEHYQEYASLYDFMSGKTSTIEFTYYGRKLDTKTLTLAELHEPEKYLQVSLPLSLKNILLAAVTRRNAENLFKIDKTKLSPADIDAVLQFTSDDLTMYHNTALVPPLFQVEGTPDNTYTFRQDVIAHQMQWLSAQREKNNSAETETLRNIYLMLGKAQINVYYQELAALIDQCTPLPDATIPVDEKILQNNIERIAELTEKYLQFVKVYWQHEPAPAATGLLADFADNRTLLNDPLTGEYNWRSWDSMDNLATILEHLHWLSHNMARVYRENASIDSSPWSTEEMSAIQVRLTAMQNELNAFEQQVFADYEKSNLGWSRSLPLLLSVLTARVWNAANNAEFLDCWQIIRTAQAEAKKNTGDPETYIGFRALESYIYVKAPHLDFDGRNGAWRYFNEILPDQIIAQSTSERSEEIRSREATILSIEDYELKNDWKNLRNED